MSTANSDDQRSTTETTRLRSIQSSVDLFTTGILEDLGLAPNWRCLELGAGAGSIAYWLAERCTGGSVTAVDLDTRHLRPDQLQNLEIMQADITRDDFAPGRFDLVHARFVLCHLPQRDKLVARAVDWLNPGGWLVVTDPYQLPNETSPFPVVRRIMGAYQRSYHRRGADLTWARSLPAQLARNGLSTVDYTGQLARMGNLINDRWKPLIDHAAPTLLAEGTITQQDLDEFTHLLADPGFIDIPQLTLAAWGQNPATT